MTRTMLDSVTADDIPATAGVVAGYVDGEWPWSTADWARFPAGTPRVHIATDPRTNAGDALDVEEGNGPPEAAPAWVQRRRRGGHPDPAVYCDVSTRPRCVQAFTDQGVAPPLWWLAFWGATSPQVAQLLGEPRVVGVQSANPTITGAHYDRSIVADFWPGVDVAPPPAPPAHQEEPMRILDHGDGTVWLLSGALYVQIGPNNNADEDSLYKSGVPTAAISPELHAALLAAANK